MNDILLMAVISTIVTLVINSVSNKLKEKIAFEDRTYERKVFLRNKYEEFGELASALLSESERFMNSKWAEAYNLANSNTSNKLITQSTIYFKEFETKSFELINSSTDHKNKLLEVASKYSDTTIGLQTHNNKGMDQARRKYENAKYEWRQLYKEHSKKYTGI